MTRKHTSDKYIHILTSEKYKLPRCQSVDPMCTHVSASMGKQEFQGLMESTEPRDVLEGWGSHSRLDRDK